MIKKHTSSEKPATPKKRSKSVEAAEAVAKEMKAPKLKQSAAVNGTAAPVAVALQAKSSAMMSATKEREPFNHRLRSLSVS